MSTDYKISELAAATTINDADLFTSVQAGVNKKDDASLVADYVTTSRTYVGFNTTAKTIQGAVNELDSRITAEDLWDRALLSGIVYYVTPHNSGDVVKIKSNIYIGSLDASSRTQIWNYETNSVLRLGSSTADSDSADAVSQGSVFYGQNAQADAMSSTDFGYARITPNRIGLYNGKNGGYTGYLFRADTTTNEFYLRDNAGSKTLDFNRATGALTLSYLSNVGGAIMFGDLAANKIVSSSQYLYWTGAGLINNSASPYFKAISNLATSGLSGLTLSNTNDGSSAISHNNQLGDSILDIDALTGTNTISTIRFGYNTTATTYRYLFWAGPASYSSHPTFTADNQIVDKKYVDDAILTENLWDRVNIPTFYDVLTPHTAADRVQLPTITGGGTYGGILYTDLDGNKTITAGGLNWSGAGFILGSSTPYFKAYDIAGAPQSGIVWGATGNTSAYIYHTAAATATTTSTLDIDAKPSSVSYASTMRFGYNTTASVTSFIFYNGKASYGAHPTFSADTEIVDKKYVDDTKAGLLTRDILTITVNGQTAFTLGSTPLSNSTIFLFVNGVFYTYTTDFTISGTTLTWVNARVLQTTDSMVAIYIA